MLKKVFIIFAILLVSYLVLYKIYTPRVSAFGCFDDCFNFAGGYFINHGKNLYTEIFYNHQMLPAYLSSLIQSNTNPINIFDLVLKHRQFVLAFGFIFNFTMIWRFGLPAFLFFVLFEFTKFYIFGDRFLAEGLLVYPLTYLIFVSWQKVKKIKIKDYDLILSSIFSWFVIFLRETFIPLSFLLLLFILFPLKKNDKFKIFSLILFLLLTIFSLSTVNLKDYYFEIFTVNKGFFAQGFDFVKIIFYPLFILTSDNWNLFRIVLIGIDLIFIFSILYLVLFKKKYSYLLVFVPLVLSNLRVVDPGRLFYDSFHMIPFYGIFLAVTFLLINEIKKYSKRIWLFLILSVLFIFFGYVISRNVFFKEKVNPHEEFFTNYSNILQIGEIVKKISKPGDTLFVDGFDEVVYWVADRPSPYKYSMYTSFMPNFSLYSDARVDMFKKNPPAFYYGSCPKEKNSRRLMPPQFTNLYIRLNSFGKPSCVFVRKDKLKDISHSQLKAAKDFGYEFPIDNTKNF